MFFESRVFRGWYVGMMLVWIALFATFNSLAFLADHWHYPAIMLLGAFVAGLTPEGGGAVAFPMLSVFFEIDRAMARDFSLMIQSIGMTSASVWLLSRKDTPLAAYTPVVWYIPICFIGFVLGMVLVQSLPVFIIQALFLSLIMTFTVAYVSSTHRGDRMALSIDTPQDRALFVLVLLAGGVCASLFGTGADIVVYTLLVTRFRMNERIATHQSIMLMAAISILGYAYRAFWDQSITGYQVSTWLCAFPVVLLMAPLGSYVLSKLNIEWMLRSIVVLNVMQMVYFNAKSPSVEKLVYSGIFSAIFFAIFWFSLARIVKARSRESEAVLDPA